MIRNYRAHHFCVAKSSKFQNQAANSDTYTPACQTNSCQENKGFPQGIILQEMTSKYRESHE